MAEVDLDDCNVLHNHGGFHEVLILSPDTMDSADYIDLSALVQDGQLCGALAWDVLTGDTVTATYNISTGALTIDASGAATDALYAIKIAFVDHTIVP